MVNLLVDFGSGLAFGVLGILLLAVGYVVADLQTPGKLGELLFVERNRNASLVVATKLFAVGGIVTTAIATSANSVLGGLVETAVFGLLGVIFLAAAFALIDALTPGKLADLIADPAPHPAVYVTMAAQVSTGAVVAAAIA